MSCSGLGQAVLPKANPCEFERVAGLDSISLPCLLLPVCNGRITVFEVGRQLNYVPPYFTMEEKIALFYRHRLGYDVEEV